MPPQAFYLVPVLSGGRPDQGLPGGGAGGGERPDQGLPPFNPNYPDQGLPPWERPADPDYDRPGGPHRWWGGGRPDRPNQDLPGGGHPWWGGRPDRPDQGLPHPPHYPTPGPVFPPIYPVDPGWGIPIGPRHPLLWLLPWLIKPATAQQSVPPPPETPKPDPDKTYLKVLVAVGPGMFKWAWLEQTPEDIGAQPK